MMSIDTFIEIGDSHHVCEDYIISGNNPVPYIILSDGCSTSNNTEMGARILCHLAKQYLKYNTDNLHEIDYWKLGLWVIHNAEQTARNLGLSKSCLTATLIVAYQLENQIRVMIYGDGSVITHGSSITVINIEYEKNAPYYLVYSVDQFRDGLYDEVSPQKFVNTIFSDGSTTRRKLAYDQPLDFKFHCDIFPKILITSDGIDTFTDGTNVKSAMDIMPMFVDFKTTKGEFLKRRLNRQMTNFVKDGITHFDDLSVGAFLNKEQ